MAMPATYAYACVRVDLPGGELSYNKLWYLTEGTVDSNEGDAYAATLADAIADDITTPMINFMSVEATLDSVRAYIVTPDGTFANTRIINLPGTVTGDMLPNFNAALILKRRDAPRRKGRGYWFIPGIPESGTEDNSLDDDSLPLLADIAAQFSAGQVVEATSFNPAFHSPTDDGLFPLTAAHEQATIATMRSRKVRA